MNSDNKGLNVHAPEVNLMINRNNQFLSFRLLSFAIFCFLLISFMTGCYNNCDVNIDYCGYKNSAERNSDPEHQNFNYTYKYRKK